MAEARLVEFLPARVRVLYFELRYLETSFRAQQKHMRDVWPTITHDHIGLGQIVAQPFSKSFPLGKQTSIKSSHGGLSNNYRTTTGDALQSENLKSLENANMVGPAQASKGARELKNQPKAARLA